MSAPLIVMRQDWHHLLFLHWRVPTGALEPLLPPGLSVDTYDGQAYVGLVPFTMTGVRPRGLPPLGGLSRFHEVNVRTYVRPRTGEPGIWFFSLDAASRLGVLGARATYRLPYFFARMTMRIDGDGLIAYASERLWPAPTPAACTLRYGPAGPAQTAVPGTLEHFLVERYLLYAWTGRALRSARVFHAPYPLQPGRVEGLQESLLVAAGIARPEDAPLCHYARRVQVRVSAPSAATGGPSV